MALYFVFMYSNSQALKTRVTPTYHTILYSRHDFSAGRMDSASQSKPTNSTDSTDSLTSHGVHTARSTGSLHSVPVVVLDLIDDRLVKHMYVCMYVCMYVGGLVSDQVGDSVWSNVMPSSSTGKQICQDIYYISSSRPVRSALNDGHTGAGSARRKSKLYDISGR